MHIVELLNKHPDWKLFQWVDEDEESEGDSECEFGNLFGNAKQK